MARDISRLWLPSKPISGRSERIEAALVAATGEQKETAWLDAALSCALSCTGA